MTIRWGILGIAVVCFAVKPVLAEEVLYCVDTATAGFKWDSKGQVSTGNFRLSRFTVRIGPAQGGRLPLFSENERVITQTSEGDNQDLPYVYHCEKHTDEAICGRRNTDTIPWVFAENGHYVRAFLPGGPPASHLDPNIEIAYGTCTKF